jgi:hypothetical protein
VVRLGATRRDHLVTELARQRQVGQAVAVNVTHLLSAVSVFDAAEAVREGFHPGPGYDRFSDEFARSDHCNDTLLSVGCDRSAAGLRATFVMRPNTGLLLTSAPVAATFPRRAPLLMDEGSTPLEGEHLETTHWEDAHHWMSIYSDLLEFKRGILDQIRRDVAKLKPDAQRAAEADLKIVEGQMEGYQKRLDLWYQRVWDLHGLSLDPEGRMIRYKGGESSLTSREFQLVRFLLNHPHRYFTVTEILDQAWAGSALFPEEVRNYVRRVRKILATMEIPCDLVNRPGRGYSLIFRGDL